MITDEIIEQSQQLEAENRELRRRVKYLNQRVKALQNSLYSALNILEPEQLEIIRKDIMDLTI